MLAKFLAENVLGGFERDVSDEQSGARWACLITEGFGTVLSTVLESVGIVGTRGSEVDVQCAVVDHGLMHLLLSFGGIGSRAEFDVAKSINSSVIKQLNRKD